MSHARSEYQDFMALAPDAFETVQALGKIAAKAGIDKQLLELIKLRASQINGCAYCVQHHILQGERLGLSADKLNLVVVWREAPQFSARERAALAWTEALTLLAGGVSDEVYGQASAEFSEKEWPTSRRRSPRSMSGTGSASLTAGPRRRGKSRPGPQLFRGLGRLSAAFAAFLRSVWRRTSSGKAWARRRRRARCRSRGRGRGSGAHRPRPGWCRD